MYKLLCRLRGGKSLQRDFSKEAISSQLHCSFETIKAYNGG